MIASTEIIGGIVLVRWSDERFGTEDLAIFQVLAGQAGIALHTALQFEEERRRRRHATALVQVSAALNAAGTIADLGRELVRNAAEAVGADRCALFVYDADATRTVDWAHVGYPSDEAVAVLADQGPLDIPVERELIATGRPVTGARLRHLLTGRPHADGFGVRGGAVVPLRIRGAVQGALYVWAGSTVEETGVAADDPHDFDDDALGLLEAIGDQAGVAVERARLVAAIHRQVAEFGIVASVNDAIGRSLDLAGVLRDALARTRETVPFTTGGVIGWDEDAGQLRVLEAIGAGFEVLGRQALPLEGSINGTVYRTGRPVRGRLDEVGPHFVPADHQISGHHVLCVPLLIEGRVTGTLHAIRDEPGPFSENDQALFRLVAGQLGIGIERARLFAVAVAAREQSDRQTRNVESVLAASQRLALQTDPASTLHTFVEGVEQLVAFGACAVYRADLDRRELHPVFARTAAGRGIPSERIAFGAGVTGMAAATREAGWTIAGADEDGPAPDGSSPPESQMSVPLVVEGTLIGVVSVVRAGDYPFSEEEFAAVRVYAAQAAASIRNAELLVRNRDLYLSGIRALASAVDAKDAYTRGHSERVSRLASVTAAALGLTRAETETIELAGLLHDIGKIGVPDSILQKPGPLDDAERAVMVGHAALGAEILAGASSDSLTQLVPLVRHHHEWSNGNGYPDGLNDEAIPIGAAVIAVVDAFDTMVTDRPYRRRRPVVAAVEELRAGAGTQFRPEVVDVFAHLLAGGLIETRLESTDEAEPWQTAEFATRPLSSTAGQLGDTRALGLLVELAAMTPHIPDLAEFLRRVTELVRRRLDYEDLVLLLVDPERGDLAVAAHSGGGNNNPDNYRQPIGVGVCGAVMRTGRSRLVPDVRFDPDFFSIWPDPQGSELVVPLIADGRTIGVLSAESSNVAAFSASDAAVLGAVAGQMASAIHVAQLHDRAKRAAATDGLTGLLNHRAFYEALEVATAEGNLLSVVVLDVEGLKLVNDSRGHLAGDALLRRVAGTIRDAVRDEDLVARYGGDEFAIVMHGVGALDANRGAARIRRDLLDATGEMGLPRATVRYGVAVLPDDGQRPYELVAVADDRLYAMRAAELVHADRHPTRD